MKINVVEYLIDTSIQCPQKTAIVDENGRYSFAQLLSNGCDLAEEIKNRNIKSCPVAVFLKKSKEMIAAFCGINLAGCFYIPLDIEQPLSRILNILSTLESAVVITDRRHIERLPAGIRESAIIIDDVFRDCEEFQRVEEILHNSGIIDTDPVYSIFTSGSTGTPKGVVVNHRGVIDYIDWAVDTFRIGGTSIIGNQAPFYFDNSTLDIYLMYATGATLNIIPESNFAFPARLIDYLNDNGITFVFWVPFVLVTVANFKLLDNKKPSTLRDVFFAGEVMPNRQLNYWRSHLPECRYVNLYGPTEITVDCTYYIVDREFKDDEPLPIGKACRNTDIIILKDRKSRCVTGEVGEICVRGSSLANGYYNNPEKTAEAFIQNPLNSSYPELIYCTSDLGYFNEYGEVMFIGRSDSQIKHKGYRIELGEIENAVTGSHLVESCCVVYDKENQKITLIYTKDQEVTPADLRKELADKLPAYMLPSSLIREEEMKRNSNGKVDRAYYNKLING